MGKPVAILGHMHICPKVEPGPVPHVGGPIIDAGQSIVTINGVPVAVVGGKALCTGVGMPDGLVSGSSIFTIEGKPVVRMGDGCAHGGKVVQGWPTVTSD
ncbi:PAAR domain-containing protein [Brenneria tiliae]|uniref:PAAR domain-containing protein n=1 Tax=Brenneria tiliae TaxID=2914984 RepID=A0ABT0MS08_9GAMM|nr:PAAR domain-containing protein [Brenneria tiliae]MCL2892048.1 PAAR domain-containing protein [Brenneria tiliae]